MKVAVRVDASRAIGTGHVRRCLALADQLRAIGAEVRFVSRDLGLDVPAPVAAAGFETVRLPAPSQPFTPDPNIPHSAWAQVDASTDAAEAGDALADSPPDWVIVDHYAFGAGWHRTVRERLGCRVAAIDDVPDRDFACDLLVDHNFAPDHRVKYAGRLPSGTTLLGGPRFALLGPAFAEAPRYAFKESVRSIGIFMGGVDAADVSSVVVAAIDECGFSGPVEIVSTAANPNLPALEARVAARTDCRLVTDLPDLAAFLARHDLQVGAAGGATWERCCLGVPTLLLVVADNQRPVAAALAEEDIVATTEPLDAVDPTSIAAALRRLIADPDRRRRLAERSRALVDGFGARRVAVALGASRLTVRPATPQDSAMMHAWRDHPATRSVSRNPQPIAREDHEAWLDRTLADPSRTLMIAQIGPAPVGVIRFDKLDERSVEVSLYLDPALHGLGLGRTMLLAGEDAIERGLDIRAEVIEGNIASARLFESAGYRRVDSTHFIKPAEARTQTE